MTVAHIPRVPYRARYKALFGGTQQELKNCLQSFLEELEAVYIDESNQLIRFNPLDEKYELEVVLNQDFEFNCTIYWSATSDSSLDLTFDLDVLEPLEIDIEPFFGNILQQFFPNVRLIYSHLDKPKARVIKSPPRQDILLNQQWIREHRSDYKGRWIALREGNLVADAESFDSLVQKVDNIKNTLLTVVY